MKLASIAIIIAGGLMSQSAVAIEKMYGVVSAGYTDLEYSNTVEESFGYKLILGHEFHRQWYVEAGFIQFADIDTESDYSTLGVQANGLYLGVVGKASHAVGELFYRLGAANVDVQAQELSADGQCKFGAAVGAVNGQTLCQFDEGIAAGIIGLGFDYYVATKTFVRLEAEYMRGKDGFDTSMISLGIRYNFN
ncbi:hypothetical protein [Marisediminitalea sp.]|uniref:hypothetical protein n=1 Tax=Marisediminitalea sp. TaxID=2662268 RepID=UPI000C639710|nr:hypothetical protein [Alteromonadaceae bacterium]MAX43375.1 hypothetical protein [Alteromonadaceae bacterium]HBY38304.1 hypothetical protein [Alteromonas sp.]|tara:strand:- start:70309 stop:70887 length:579 start_codon:yes stop_codon:yes gene_type:complete